MKVRLVGVHTVRKRLSDGRIAEYHYAWRGGPRLHEKPGTKAFAIEYARLTRHMEDKARPDTLGALVTAYLQSPEFRKLATSTRRDYERAVDLIRASFETFPVSAIEARGARTLFRDWRDSMADTPRAADLYMAVLARIFSWSLDREEIGRNPLERIGKLSKGTRRDSVWTVEQINAVLTRARPEIANVARVALLTMQRQGDVLSMPAMAWDGERALIRQGKTGARLRVWIADELKPIFEEARATGRQRVLVNSRGENWTSSGFRASWRKEMQKVGVSGVTFHDLRGSGITYAYALGIPIDRIAEISGHSESQCETIIRRHYLAGADVVDAIRRGTKGA
ncbi:tyrosine-type recombinase/integrase [Zhengella sp. ZM62]|uniref:tyrosine-type recombinase/integrase n=1 Tax=Zhengella sedimenti TaxID=3390035 RepID=UPI003974743A